MMADYKPSAQSQYILDRAWMWVQSVPYATTARWVFYRLLQDGTYDNKGGYKHLLALTAKARKRFYGGWRPWTLADDTRSPVLMQRSGHYGLHLRGHGFKDKDDWLQTVAGELNCPLDRWTTQDIYAEVYFEAHAMQGQFLHYANENLPLLAFGGDVSIAAKWQTAQRLAKRYLELKKPIHIYYFGDLDPKGLTIPQSAWRDIGGWAGGLLLNEGINRNEIGQILNYHRIGINQEQIDELEIPENPERPGTYQWEALNDEQAERLIERANDLLDLDTFSDMETLEDEYVTELKEALHNNNNQ